MGLGSNNPAGGSSSSVLSADLIRGGTSEIDGDQLDVDFTPSNYTPALVTNISTHLDHLASHLKGIDDELATISGAHLAAADLIEGGSDPIDADQLSITWTPSNYTPADTPAEAGSATQLTAHLYGLDQALAGKASTTHASAHQNGGADEISVEGLSGALADAQTPTAHASTHITSGSDEIDGDQLDIDWNPANYTPTTDPTEVDNADHLTAHLAGIDAALANAGLTAADLIDGGSDPLDGDQIEITWTPSNYTRTTTPSEASAADQLTAHLAGIDGTLARTTVNTSTGDYLEAQMSGDQAALSAGTVIDVDTLIGSRGDLAVDGDGIMTGFKAGRTYLLIGTLAVTGTGTAATFRFFDRTANAQIGNQTVTSAAQDVAGTESSGQTVISSYAPTVDSSVDLRVAAVTGSPTADQSGGTRVVVMEVGPVVREMGGGLEYMDTIRVTSAVASVTFSSAGDGDVKRALDGNVDGEYVMVFRAATSAAATLNIRPNGATTNQESIRVTHQSSSERFATMAFEKTGEAPDIVMGQLYLDARTTIAGVAQRRLYRSYSCNFDDSAGDSFGRGFWGSWNETSTNITSIVVAPSTGNISAGSEFVLFRRSRHTVRADSADSYERHTTQTIGQGASTTTINVGDATYGGSLVGVSVLTDSAVTAGTVTINVKVNTVTKLSCVLDTTNTLANRNAVALGTYAVVAGDQIDLEIVADGDYTNAAAGNADVMVNATLTNEGLFIQPANGVVAETILAANAATISVGGLDGDAHGEYIVDYHLLLAASNTHTITVQPNAAATNLVGTYSADFNASPTAVTTWQIAAPAAHTSREVIGRIKMQAARTSGAAGTAVRRTILANTAAVYTDSPYGNHYNFAGALTNAGANLTSLDFVNDQASGFLTGSRVTVRKA